MSCRHEVMEKMLACSWLVKTDASGRLHIPDVYIRSDFPHILHQHVSHQATYQSTLPTLNTTIYSHIPNLVCCPLGRLREVDSVSSPLRPRHTSCEEQFSGSGTSET